MNPAMSWHGTKGFPGGREIKLDPGLKPSTAIYASLNLLSSTSTARVDDFHPPPPPPSLFRPRHRRNHRDKPLPSVVLASRSSSHTVLLSPGTIVSKPSSRSKSWPAATRMITSSYFTLRRPPPLIILFAMLSRSLPSYTCHRGERSSRFFHPRQSALFRLFLGPPTKEPTSFSNLSLSLSLSPLTDSSVRR